MIDLEQSSRSEADVLAAIRADQAQYADAIAAFHQAFYASRQTHGMTYFEGVPILKNPLDLWVYQELIWALRPTLLIETGTAFGGSALFFARQFDKLGSGAVVSIDLEPAETVPTHPRISYVKGLSSVDARVVESVAQVAASHPRVMVVLDSDHAAPHVLDELHAYAPLVTLGQFLVVEDTNINGRPVAIDWKGGPGPGPAVDAWLPEHPEFEAAVWPERYLITHSPGGWLRRVA